MIVVRSPRPPWSLNGRKICSCTGRQRIDAGTGATHKGGESDRGYTVVLPFRGGRAGPVVDEGAPFVVPREVVVVMDVYQENGVKDQNQGDVWLM